MFLSADRVVTGVGLVLDLAAFLAIWKLEARNEAAVKKLEERKDFITKFEAVTAVPVNPLPTANTPEQRAFNEAATILLEAEQEAEKRNKEEYLAAKADVARAQDSRAKLVFALKCFVAAAILVQIAALVL